MTAPAQVIGAQRRLIVPFTIKLLQIVSGYLLLRSLVAFASRYLFGYRVDTKLTFDGRYLKLHSTAWLLGRKIRETEETMLGTDLVSVGVERRYPYLLLLLGSLGVILGAVYGVGWFVDGIQVNYVPIAMVGLGVLGAGVVLDIALGSLADYVGSRASLLITVRTPRRLGLSRRFRVCGVDEEAAQTFTRHLVHARS